MLHDKLNYAIEAGHWKKHFNLLLTEVEQKLLHKSKINLRAITTTKSLPNVSRLSLEKKFLSSETLPCSY